MKTSAPIKYILSEIPEQKQIDKYVEAGIDAGQLVSMYQYFTDSDIAKLMLKMYKAYQVKHEKLYRLSHTYAYEEMRKEAINTQIRVGKTWLEAISKKNRVISGDEKLKGVTDLGEYFSILKRRGNYVIAFSCADDCSNHWLTFLKVSGLPLRSGFAWRDSYATVVDGDNVKVEQASKEEVNLTYEFLTGSLDCAVEYAEKQIRVDCGMLEQCKIRVKSKGVTSPSGALRSEILVDNIDSSMNHRTGLNIVVIDRETGNVADLINVNTYADALLKINR